MLRCLLFGFMGMLLAGQAPAPAPSTPPAMAEPARKVDPARLEVSPKGRVQIPSVGPREKKQLQYLFKNISTAPITLRTLDLAPGVTVEGPALQQPIGAGASAALTMTIDATDWVGWQKRNVRLATDDPKQGEYFLPVEMTVRPDLTVDGERKTFGDVKSHETPQVKFIFTRETGDPTQIRLVSKLPDYLEAEWESAKNITELRLSFHSGKVAPGVALGLETLQIETNAPHQPKFTLYVDWMLKRAVEATPARVVFLDTRTLISTLRLRRRDGKALAIEKMAIEGDGFKVTPASKEPAEELQLRIHRTAAREGKAMLILHFVGEAEVLKVPLAYLPGK